MPTCYGSEGQEFDTSPAVRTGRLTKGCNPEVIFSGAQHKASKTENLADYCDFSFLVHDEDSFQFGLF